MRDDPRLDIATWLVEAGAGESARRVLGRLRGARANRLRAASREARLRPGVYALAVVEGGEGIVVPLEPTPGLVLAPDEAYRDACEAALEAVRRTVGVPGLPSLRFPFEEWLGSSGQSIGLPAVIALMAHVVPARRPRYPVLATGTLVGGRIGTVDGLADKIEIAKVELAGTRGTVLAPRQDALPDDVTVVDDLAAALRAVFGEEPLSADSRQLSLDEAIQRSWGEPSHEAALSLLDALQPDELAPADLARIELERAMRLRHLGRTAEAVQAQESGSRLLGEARHVIGAEAMERYELSYWSTALDEFRVEEARDALEERLRRPFLVLRNEVRCRGMLAQALGMAGSAAEAVQVRLANLPLQQSESWLKSVLPGTCCYLALDSARAGDDDGFFEHLGRTFETTLAGDENQWRYNATVAVRGLVLLGRYEHAIEWAEGRGKLAGCVATPWLVGIALGKVTSAAHPEVSAARALCRAFRVGGSPRRAELLGERVAERDAVGVDLVAWLLELTRLEAALAQRDHGDVTLAGRSVAAARQRMALLHPAASRFHADVLECPLDELEAAIDRVWY